MRRFYKYIVSLAAVLLSLPAFAEGEGKLALLRFADRLDKQCLSFDYSYYVVGRTPLKGSGTIMTQGNAYTMSGNGISVVCDGTTRWMVDEEACEVVIESVGGYADIIANPVLCLRNWEEYFRISSESNGAEGIVTVSLVPRVERISSYVNSMSVTFSFGTIVKAEMDMRGEGRVKVEMTNVKWGERLPASSFIYDVSQNKSFVVTDLR